MTFVDHLKCSRCPRTHSHTRLQGLSPCCSAPLLVRYRLDEVGRLLNKTDLLDRPADMWRYLEVLPAEREEEIVTLGEGFTPLIPLQRLGRELGLDSVYVKDEACNPTGSFKARGLSAAVTMAQKLGAKKLCMPTAGNAGGALAAYGARAGLEVFIFLPSDTPLANIVEAQVCGAHVTKVDGVISDAGREMAARKDIEGWFDLSTLKEPYRIEGKKTMGYELAEQFAWELPDVILYPTGGGTGLIGMWKAFEEMEELGWIGEQRPRMVAVQSEGCAPIVKAFQQGKQESEAWENAATFASGIRVPKAIGDFLILDYLRQSQGRAVSVSEKEIYRAIGAIGASEGIFFCPEGAACWAALEKLAAEGWVMPAEKVVVFNTGAGQKYLDSMQRFRD